MHSVLTIGHSNHSPDTFVALLVRHAVGVVVDVRSNPYSRFNPQFNREAVSQTLREHSIKYMFFGAELGGRSEDNSCYKNGRIQYELLAKTKLFGGSIERVVVGANEYRIALMCAEKEPLECHRTLLVSPALEERGVTVEHIHADGHLESHHDAMNRLLDHAKLPREDVLMERPELIAEAIAWQGNRVGHTNEASSTQTAGESS